MIGLVRRGWGALAGLLGRRGAVLLVLSLAYGLIGVRSLIAPQTDEGHFELYAYLHPDVRAVLWGIPALLGILSAFRRDRRDGSGFAALTIPATVLSVSYLWSFVGYLLGATDWPLGWASAATWLLILALLLIVSGWAEVEEAPKGHRVSIIAVEEESP